MLVDLLKDIFHLFYPNNCTLCQEQLHKGETHLCFSCLLQLPETNFFLVENNPVEEMFKGRANIHKGTSFYYFNKEGGVHQLLHEIKYRGNIHLAEFLGNQMGQKLLNWLNQVDVIVPIPLAKKKELQRGFNQSYYIGKGLSEAINIPVDTKLVSRIKNTETQTKKSRTARFENMKNAFEWDIDKLKEVKHILLLDDVITTGATIESCMDGLPSNLDIKISILSLAIAIES